jgi:hypothetical protein
MTQKMLDTFRHLTPSEVSMYFHLKSLKLNELLMKNQHEVGVMNEQDCLAII